LPSCIAPRFNNRLVVDKEEGGREFSLPPSLGDIQLAPYLI